MKNAPLTDQSKQGACQTDLDVNNITLAAQRHRLLFTLVHMGSVNTLYARERLNILHPAGRIKDLREEGHKITTDRIEITDQRGRKHIRVGLYTLVKLAEVSR